MTAKLVFNVNAGKSEAIQTTDETRAVLEEHITRKHQLLIAEQQSLEKNIWLVVNLYEALERFQVDLTVENKVLTVENILKIKESEILKFLELDSTF